VGGRGFCSEAGKTQSQKKGLKTAPSPTSPLHPVMMAGNHFSQEKPPSSLQKYTRKWQVNKPYKAMETRRVAVPRCTVVAGQIDLYTGGKGAKTPMRKLIP